MSSTKQPNPPPPEDIGGIGMRPSSLVGIEAMAFPMFVAVAVVVYLWIR